MGNKKFWELTNDVLANLDLGLPFDVSIGLVINTLEKASVTGLLKGGLGGLEAESLPRTLFVVAAFCFSALIIWSVVLLFTTSALSFNENVKPFMVSGFFIFLIPIFFNGLKVALCGVVAILGLKALALYEIQGQSKGTGAYLTEEALAHDTKDCKSTVLRLLNLGAIFPLASWGHHIEDFTNELKSTWRRRMSETRLLYQNLWFSRKYKKSRRGIKRFFESPARARRYWYLTLRWETRKGLAWLGIPFRKHPQFKPGSTLLGSYLRRAPGLALEILGFVGARGLISYFIVFLHPMAYAAKGFWNNRPSLIYSFIRRFQPGAPSTPALDSLGNKFRFVNLASDMEVFGSRGSSLLVFMFLVWSFLARVLLVMCLLGLF